VLLENHRAVLLNKIVPMERHSQSFWAVRRFFESRLASSDSVLFSSEMQLTAFQKVHSNQEAVLLNSLGEIGG